MQPESVRQDFLNKLPNDEAAQLLYYWPFWSRPAQQPPTWPWRIWLILAGRGFGKTRTGAEWVRQSVKHFPLVNVIAPTSDDARDVMIEGESGILAICPPSERPTYRASMRRLEWPNGARTLIFTADEPDRLRGKQHMRLWADELAAWRYAEAWDQALFGLRLGDDPRAVVTTTPKPITIIRKMVTDPTVAVTRGSTYDNRGNLAPAFFESIITRYEGTRIGRQELNAELLEDIEGALWQRSWIDRARVPLAPDMQRIVVGVDPSGGSGDGNDEQGIVVAGKGVDGHAYVLSDTSCRLSPDGWGRRVVQTYLNHRADRVVVESNFGGDMATHVVQTAARAMGTIVPVSDVKASRGKVQRAEPIAALYEQGKVHHVGGLSSLEDQLCLAAGMMVSTFNGDVPIEWVRVGEYVLTRRGYRRVLRAGCTGAAKTMWVFTANGSVRCTPNHPIYVQDRGFVAACEVLEGDKIVTCPPHLSGSASSFRANGSISTPTATTSQAVHAVGVSTTASCGPVFTGQSQTDGTFITGTSTRATMTQTTSWDSRRPNTLPHMVEHEELSEILPRRGVSGDGSNGQRESRDLQLAPVVGSSTARQVSDPCSALSLAVVVGTAQTEGIEPVFNLTVEGEHEFFANGLLTHNCTWVPGQSDTSPDRLDALVWALTALMLGGSEVAFY